MTIERISTNFSGGQSEGSAFQASASSTGRYVTYVSDGRDVAGGHADSGPGVYVKDMTTGDTQRIDRAADDGPTNGVASSARIAGDGRFVVYLSSSNNLLPGGGDNNGTADVFLYDRVTQETKLITRGADGTSAEGTFRDIVVSNNGRYIAYVTDSSDIPLEGRGDDNTAAYTSNVYVYDRDAGTTTNLTPKIYDGVQVNRLHSIDDSGIPYYDGGFWRNIDGARQVQAWNFQGGAHTHVSSVAAGGHYLTTVDGAYSVWVVPTSDRSVAQQFWIKGPGGELKDNRGSTTSFIGEVALAANGRFVIYTSNFDVIAQADTEGMCLYVWDLDTGTVKRLATAPSGQPIGGIQISADGHWITFNSFAALTEDDTNGTSDIFRVVNPFGSTGSGSEGEFPDNDRILGTPGQDFLLGTNGAEYIDALAEDDTVYGGAGNDIIHGREGNDILLGEMGDDKIAGEDGDDALIGGVGNDLLQGGASNDDLFGDSETAPDGEPGDGNDTLDGGAGRDRLYGNGGNDRLFGGAGYDELRGGDGNDSLFGGAGEDLVLGGKGDDYLLGNDGQTGEDDLSDTIIGHDGDDTIKGVYGDDKLWGEVGDDDINGGADNDAMYGGAGDDTYAVDHAGDRVYENDGEGTDTVKSGIDYALTAYVENLNLTGTGNIGGAGNGLSNSINGNSGDNVLSGGLGNDSLYGWEGDDSLNGGNDHDRLSGGSGSDTLFGGHGNDVLGGGTEADTFVFSDIGTNGHDHLTDFQHGLDRLVFTGADYGFAAGHVLTGAEFTVGAVAVGSSAQFIWNAADGRLYFDGDGNGAGGVFELALISHGATVTKEDILFQ